MKKVLIGLLTTMLIILLGIGGYVLKIIGTLSSMDGLSSGDSSQNWEGDPDDFGIPDDVLGDEKGAVHILLLGSDRRHKNENGRSDAIMIATLDKENGQLKLTSIMRDLYVSIPERQGNRINAAFSFGGPRLALQTVNQNFSLNISRYVTVDFWGLEEIINAMGGIEMDIKEKEIKAINDVIKELNNLDQNYKTSPILTRAGIQPLDGKQAVAYARIRKVGDGDSERTERQRKVMTQMFNKMKSVNPLRLPDLLATIIPYTDTNIPATEIISLGTSVLTAKDRKIYQYRVPAQDTYNSQTIRGMAVYVPDLERNKELLHDFLYEKAYTNVME